MAGFVRTVRPLRSAAAAALLVLAMTAPAAAQQHFPSDAAIREVRLDQPVAELLPDPRYPVSPAGLRRAFVVLPIVLAALLVAAVGAAWRRTGATPMRSAVAALGVAVGLLLWLSVTHLAAAAGWLHFGPPRPTMLILFAALVTLSVGLGASPVGRRLSSGLPLAVLVASQSFRLPLEWMLHRAYLSGLMPVQMSYSGLNFDVFSGASSIVVAILLATGHAGLRTARLWNLAATLLLCNIVVIALLSAPTPFRLFRNEPANVWVTMPPYVWLPAVMVAFAILGHVVIFRRLRADRRLAHPNS